MLYIHTSMIIEFTTATPYIREIERYEGECHVYLPCPIYGRASPSWKIDEKIYSISTLHQMFDYQPAYRDLVIITVKPAHNGLTHQCLIPSEGSEKVIEGPIFRLTVRTGINY